MWSYMASTSTSTPAQYLIILLDLARQRGVAASEMLAGTELTEAGLTTIGARISESDFIHVVEQGYLLTGDNALGLHLGTRLNLSAHATVGQAFLTCETLQQVISFFLKYYHILAPALELEYEIKDGRFWLIPRSDYSDDHPVFSHELLFAAICHTMQFLINQPGLSFRIELPYSAPEHAAEYYPLFGDDVRFDCPQGRISFPEEWLEVELPSSNPALLALYEGECKRLLADLKGKVSLTEQTLQLLRRLEGHYPQMPQVASMLNLSPRTFRRRLETEQASFQQLLDQVRAEHASHYLPTELPLLSIAYMVGFNDVSNFRRAFIKWTGHTPGEIRSGA